MHQNSTRPTIAAMLLAAAIPVCALAQPAAEEAPGLPALPGAVEATLETAPDLDSPRVGQTSEFDGELGENDFFNSYEVEVHEGDHLIVNVRTTEFDPYLSLASPSGEAMGNDDWNMTNTHAHIHMIAEEGGTWTIRVAGFDVNQAGPYHVDIYTGPTAPDGSMPPQVESGTLSDDDDEIAGAPERYVDRYEIEGVAGDHITANVRSHAFDTFIMLRQVDGDGYWENDDYLDSRSVSQLGVTLPADGTYSVEVTSFEANELGPYNLVIEHGSPPPSPVASNETEYAGDLSADDETRTDGVHFDTYDFAGQAGEQVTLDLTSEAFDTFLNLALIGEGDTAARTWENDDFAAGDSAHSQIKLTLPADGAYRVVVSSYDRGETGSYLLTLTRDSEREGDWLEGELAAGDMTHRDGELIDWIEVQTEPGQTIEVDLHSEDFDTFVIVQSPTGETAQNDDWEGDGGRSRLSTAITRPGVHRVGVTTFEPGMSGQYKLDIRITEGNDPRLQREVISLLPGGDVEGALAYGDVMGDNGQFADRYTFDAVQGQQVVIDLKASHFDTYLSLVLPDGETIANDDFDGEGHSQISFEAEQSGPYRLMATSFGSDELGDYQLSLSIAEDANQPDIPGQRVYGLFIGISNYGGFGDLPFCAEDAQLLHRSLRDQFGMLPGDAVLLTDDKATTQAVEEALADLGDRASADDVLIIFYSGHGGQVDISAFTAQDPDAKDETLVLVDGEMTADAFSELLGQSKAGTTLVMLDACFSGGFAKDVVSAPGRMGLFSSEEDVLSMVAEQFQAGGYLSMFVAEAFGEKRDEADLNTDQMLTALELCEYVSKRYEQVVRESKPNDQYADTAVVDPGVNLGFQNLVTDRGGVNANHVLIRW